MKASHQAQIFHRHSSALDVDQVRGLPINHILPGQDICRDHCAAGFVEELTQLIRAARNKNKLVEGNLNRRTSCPRERSHRLLAHG